MKVRAKCWECRSVEDHGTQERDGILYLRPRCNKCRKERRTPEQRTRAIWREMGRRCNVRTCREYRWYGGRGIKVCKRWGSFKNFLKDMGPVPFRGASIERIDNSKGYSPQNCVWIDKRKQSHNQRSNRMLTFDGKTQHLGAWAREVGIDRRALTWRLKAGWSVEAALTTPIRKISR